MALGDIDGDGDLDILLACVESNANEVWLNDGSASFTAASGGMVRGSTNSVSVAIADIDGDGDVDIFVGTNGGANQVWVNQRPGAQLVGTSNLVSAWYAALSVGYGDADGDGDLDLYIGVHYNSPNKLFLNDGDGTFTEVTDTAVRGMGIHDRRPYDGGGSTTVVLWADIDQDGDNDLFLGTRRSVTCRSGPCLSQSIVNELYINDGTGHFTQSFAFGTANSVTNTAAFGDVNGDGKLDLLVGNSGRNELWVSSSSGFTARSDGPAGYDHSTTNCVIFGDVTGDGKLDIYENRAGKNVLWIGDGYGGFTSRSGGPAHTTSIRSSVFGDVDGDGDLDIVAGIYDGSNQLWLNGMPRRLLTLLREFLRCCC